MIKIKYWVETKYFIFFIFEVKVIVFILQFIFRKMDVSVSIEINV